MTRPKDHVNCMQDNHFQQTLAVSLQMFLNNTFTFQIKKLKNLKISYSAVIKISFNISQGNSILH